MRKIFLSSYKRYISLITMFLFFFGMVSIPVPVVKAKEKSVLRNEAFKSPVITKDGTVTFKARHEGETLFLKGSMNDWNNTGIEMTKNPQGIFQVEMKLLPGTYEYKYFPVSHSLDNGFIDGNNSNFNNTNSVIHVSGLKIISKDTIKLGETMN